MGIFDKMKNYFDTKRQDRLESDLRVIQQRQTGFNPKYFKNLDYMSPDQEFTLNVQENLTWFIGKPRMIRLFYATYPELTQDLNYFWAKAPANYRKVHSGVPKNISRKMSTILFAGGIANDVTIYKVAEDGTISNEIDQNKSSLAVDNLEILKDKVEFMSKIKGGAVIESYSGHLFAKYSVDVELSNYPILEFVDLRNGEVVKERGITKYIIFKNYFDFNKKKYVHKEIHSLNEQDEPVITNKLYEINQYGEKEKPLASLEQTRELLPEFTFTGLNGWIAFEKPNRLPNNDFLDTPYGASDYAGGYSSFDALDETLSEIYAEIRNNKTLRYVPDVFLKYSEEGDVAKLDEFITNYVKTTSSLAEGTEHKIDITNIEDKQDSLEKKWRIAMTTVCNNAGINPIALGVTGLESIDSSEGSQQERNKATLETRGDKLESWKPFTENIELQLLALNSWMQRNYPNLNQEGLNKIDIDFSNCNVNVAFGDYIVSTKQELIDLWGSAREKGVATLDTSIKKIWEKEWDESQILEEINLLRFEQGMSLDNPSNLPGLDGQVIDPIKTLEDEADEPTADKS